VGACIGIDARTIESVPNGLGTYARHLVEALTRLESEHSYVVLRRPNSGPPLAPGRSVREVIIPGNPTNPQLGRAISRLGLDLYHSLHHFLPLGLRVPRVVVTLHDLIWLEHRHLIRSGLVAPLTRWITHLYGRVAMRYALGHADRIITVSRHSRSRAVEYFGFDPSRFEVVHHGVAHSLFPQAPHRLQPSLPPYFFCLGNSRPYKNLATALRAFAVCAQRRPDLRLTVTGRGDSNEELSRLARRLGIGDRVTFTGIVSHEDMVTLMHGAVALVFPSYVEGFGFPVLEAMAAGCPVVASNCPAVTEVAGNAAVLCDPASFEAFAAAMLELLETPEMRLELRSRGVERAAEFTWSRCAKRTLAVYDAVLTGACCPTAAVA
jgi:glycosyltransferase involved in cell wall biosynthesis